MHTVDIDDEIVNALAETAGVPYPVCLSPELSALLKPNRFLSHIGIRYEERLKSVFSILKGNLIPKYGGEQESLPDEGITFDFTIVKGPFIREDPIVIKAELAEGDNMPHISLSAILMEEE